MPENMVFSADDQQPVPNQNQAQAAQPSVTPSMTSELATPAAFAAVSTEPETQQAVEPELQPAPAPDAAHTSSPTQKPRQNLELLAKLPSLPVLILLAVVLAIVRFWQPADLFNWGFQSALFVIGSILGQVLFVFEPYFGRAANSIGGSLANNRLTSDLPEIPGKATSLTDTSPLKQGLILFLLPIVGIFLLSSSRWPLGLGFLLGVSWVYFWDILGFLRNAASEFPKEYFPPQQAESRSVQTALIWYGLYMVILVIGLAVV